MDKQPITIGELIGVLAIMAFLLWLATYQIWYSILHKAPECIVAQDVITCVKVKELGGNNE